MSSTREQILNAVLTKLRTIDGMNEKNCQRSRTNPFNEKDYPCITMFPVMEIPSEDVTEAIDQDLTLLIVLYQKGDVPDSDADVLMKSIKDKMMEDRSFGGLASDVSPGEKNWDFQQGNKGMVEVEMNFQIKYREVE